MPDKSKDPGETPLYPAIPEDLKGLSDDELKSLADQVKATVEKVHERDPETLGERVAEDVISATRVAVDGLDKLEAELAERDEARNALESELDDLTSRVVKPAEPEATEPEAPEATETAEAGTETPESSETPEATETPAEPLPVAASARRRPLPSRRTQNAPPPAARGGGPRKPAIVAAADLPGFALGSQLPDMTAVARAIIDRRLAMGDARTGDKVLVASIQYPFSEERTLHADDQLGNAKKIDAVTSPEALTAAGGICVIPEPIYDVKTFGITDRPVSNSIARFGADRGGIEFYPPVGFDEVTDAIGIITDAEASAGGDNALKTCQVIPCPGTETAFVDSIYRCVEVDNLGARTFPERLQAFLQNVLVRQARLAELYALDAIDAASTAVTAAVKGGAITTLMGILGVQAASFRSVLRLDPETTLRVILPAWSLDLLVQDLVRQGFDPDRFGRNRAGVASLLQSLLGINITWELDDVVFGAQGAGATVTWPAEVTFRMFPEGSFLHLDAGQLDLGLVRDSVTNERNAYQLFAETFEGFAFVGIESRKVTVGIVPSGQTGMNASLAITAPTY